MKGVIYFTNLENKERAEALFEQTIVNYQFIGIKPIKVTRQRHKLSAHFENGDCWQCIAPCENARGIKTNLAYVPYDAWGRVQEIAISTAVAQPYHGVIYY
jgi:hypothetical protein